MCVHVDSPVPVTQLDRLRLEPQVGVQLTVWHRSIDERLPGGPAVSASSHLISSPRWKSLWVGTTLYFVTSAKSAYLSVHIKLNNFCSLDEFGCASWRPRIRRLQFVAPVAK